jgi:hypothetical protein
MQISKGFQKQQWSTELGTSTLNLMTSGGVFSGFVISFV